MPTRTFGFDFRYPLQKIMRARTRCVTGLPSRVAGFRVPLPAPILRTMGWFNKAGKSRQPAVNRLRKAWGALPHRPTIYALVAQLAEAGDLKSPQCQFESDQGHQVYRGMEQSGQLVWLIPKRPGVRIPLPQPFASVLQLVERASRDGVQ